MVIEIGPSASRAVLLVNDAAMYLELSVIPLVDVDLVWPTLVDLHLAATGARPRRTAQSLSTADAFDSWSRATLGLAGYLRAVSPEAAARVLGSASDFAEFNGSLEGLDSVYLAAMSSAGRNLNLGEAELDRAAGLIDQIGMPGVPGGGAAGTLISGAGSNGAALANHASLLQQLEAAGNNPIRVLDILARESVNAAASGARSVIPGSGVYVKATGDTLVSTGEGVCWGIAAGGVIGTAAGGPAGFVVGAVIGGIASGLLALGTAIGHLFSGETASDTAKGDKVPISPPAPITDGNGKTTNVGADGATSTGRPTGGAQAPGAGQPPGPKATQIHCPRGDDEGAPPILPLPGWGDAYNLLPAAAPYGPGLDALCINVGDAAVQIPSASQIAYDGGVVASPLWGELLIPRGAVNGGRGTRVVEAGTLERVSQARRHAQLAEVLVLNADPSATVHDALAALRTGRTPAPRIVGAQR